tara:strand:+ start:5434 stop:6528 length:1095 start_codon:yes stop_codon:yes gene_type:complete
MHNPTQGGLTLSVTDQSPIRKDDTPRNALLDTVKLAQAVENLGYTRYWVAEHHNTGTYAGASPEILIGQILANTSTIRVGSGGVMLSHYSSLKVAEQFRILESLYPNRVDLGIGRAPGSDQATMFALAYPKRPVDIQTFPQQVADLIGYLRNNLQPDHPFATVKAQAGPDPESSPEVWLLGSSDYSANLAAYLGLPFAFADFFGNTAKHGPAVTELYRKNFKPSSICAEPKVNVTVQVVCAPTEDEAKFIASSRNLNRARRLIEAKTGERIQGLSTPEEASATVLDDGALNYVSQYTSGYYDGDPKQVVEALKNVAEIYETNDIGIVTIAYHLKDRIRSYQLIANELGLTSNFESLQTATPLHD